MSDTPTADTAATDAANTAALADALAGTATASTTDDAGTDGESTPEPTVEELQAALAEWKGHARKHEDQAKANKTAAEELAALKRAQMSDADKAAADAAATSEAVTEAEARAEKAEAALLRATIAVDLSLSKEDAAVLAGITGDEAALRAVAARLAGSKAPAAPTGVVPTQGKSASTGAASPAQAFEDAMSELF